jgi:hypothetical protein
MRHHSIVLMPEWLWQLLFAAVVVQIPFEFRQTLLGLSNLQWSFIAFALSSVPLLLKHSRPLMHDRLIQAGGLFVAIQWAAALYAPEFHMNAMKAAIRFTAGLLLLAIVRAANAERLATKFWTIAASIAAGYALLAYAGLGFCALFRSEEFYIGQIQRLSGSFEYPNTAAAYFGMALPVAWYSEFRPLVRFVAAFLLWAAIVLTFSKGALVAVPLMVIIVGRREWKRGALLLAAGVLAYAVLLPINPYLLERIYGPSRRNPIAAEYRSPWNDLKENPGQLDTVPLTIRNTGVSTWRSSGLWGVSIACRWWDMDSQRFTAIPPVVTPLPRNVARGETIELPAAFRTPDSPGHYLLVFELFSHNFDWFSRTGVIPLLIRTDIQPNVERVAHVSDISRLYRRGPQATVLTAKVSRSVLWMAALKIFASHPFGIGPDNYRLAYGKYIGATRWDTHVYSNNLYLEILVGSGIPGLTAFLLLAAARQWGSDAASMGAGIFLVHGVVDVFLMATPIYFAFWMLLGMPRDEWKSEVEVQCVD